MRIHQSLYHQLHLPSITFGAEAQREVGRSRLAGALAPDNQRRQDAVCERCVSLLQTQQYR